MDSVKTIVFYSYKGGTGRTLALANLANYLALFDFKVCIIDMDLEAPGVHYKFYADAAKNLKRVHGVVDYIDYFSNNHIPPPKITPYLLHYNKNITIMPSGDVTNNKYWLKLSAINWHALLYEEDSLGLRLLLDLIGRLQKSIEINDNFDFLLIDSRAGITPLSGLCTTLFGDVLVTFFTTSQDSLDGTKQMIKNVRATRKVDNLPEIKIIPVLTRFEKHDDNDKEDMFIQNKFSFLFDKKSIKNNKLCVIHANREIERNERTVYGLEILKDDHILSDEPLKLDYLQFFTQVIDDDLIGERIALLSNGKENNEHNLSPSGSLLQENNLLFYVTQHKRGLEEYIKSRILKNPNIYNDKNLFYDIDRYYEAGGESAFIDEYYLNSFINYNEGDKTEARNYKIDKILLIIKNLDAQKRIKTANILINIQDDEYQNELFCIYNNLVNDNIFAIDALTGMMKLFYKYPDLYYSHMELLPKLNDPRLYDVQFNDLTNAFYNVYIKYFKPIHLNKILNIPNIYNYLLQYTPLILLEIYKKTGKIKEIRNLTKNLFESYTLNNDFIKLDELKQYLIDTDLLNSILT